MRHCCATVIVKCIHGLLVLWSSVSLKGQYLLLKCVFCVVDLVPKENVERWIQCLQQEFPVVAFKASTQIQDKTVVGGSFYTSVTDKCVNFQQLFIPMQPFIISFEFSWR